MIQLNRNNNWIPLLLHWKRNGTGQVDAWLRERLAHNAEVLKKKLEEQMHVQKS